MGMMSEIDGQISTRHVGKEFMEDSSDFILTREVTADNVEAARLFGQYLKGKCDCRGSNHRWSGVWLGKGGKLVTIYTIYVDGIEDAIERRNDAWASQQTAIDEQCGMF